MQIFNDKKLDLDLNGPILEFLTQPESVTGVGTTAGGDSGGSVTLIGIATALLPDGVGVTTTIPSGGFITYRWHEVGVGALSDSTYVTGTATTTLTLSNLITPTDNDREYFLQSDFVEQRYVTGNANNEPLNSGIATVTVSPLIQITSQPSSSTPFPNVSTATTVIASLSDSSFGDDLTYQWQLDGTDATNGTITKSSVITTVSGATTPTLTLSSASSGIGFTANCVISSASASNSPIVSDVVNYTVQSLDDSNVVAIESIDVNETTAELSTTDLSNGAHTFSIDSDVQLYSFYAKDKDLDVEMDLFGGGSSGISGEGGFSRIRFTMQKEVEYVIAGLIGAVNTPFLYRKAQLIAVVGEGGKAGLVGTLGGNGGGIGVEGASGSGLGSPGQGGGDQGNRGEIGENGIFGSAIGTPPLVYSEDSTGTRGKTISCTKGVYWRQQGISPCSDVGSSGLGTPVENVRFRLSNGNEVTNTATINRGYKAGYNIMQTAGGAFAAFRGGNGAYGGQGGQSQDAAGGGGSGYSDGTVTLISTQLGGSTEAAKVILRIQS